MKTKFIIICLAYFFMGLGLGFLFNGNSIVLLPCVVFHSVVMFTVMQDFQKFIKTHDVESKEETL